jgi:hypothetical protein
MRLALVGLWGLIIERLGASAWVASSGESLSYAILIMAQAAIVYGLIQANRKQWLIGIGLTAVLATGFSVLLILESWRELARFEPGGLKQGIWAMYGMVIGSLSICVAVGSWMSLLSQYRKRS